MDMLCDQFLLVSFSFSIIFFFKLEKKTFSTKTFLPNDDFYSKLVDNHKKNK